jgi:hypothetical protein
MISSGFQHLFSGRRDDHGVNAPFGESNRAAASAPVGGHAGSAVTTGGAAGAVTAVPLPEGRSHEDDQQLDLNMGDRGDAVPTGSPVPPFRWLP